MIYDVIIVGAGAAGLFTGANYSSAVKGLILEKTKTPGNKLLLSGAGQCNLTYGGSIKDFVSHYGENGRKIRYILYKFNNKSLKDYFEKLGIALTEREDGKVFPASLKSKDIVNALVQKCYDNGFQFNYNSPVDVISYNDDENSRGFKTYTVTCPNGTYKTRKLIIACGGCSYPATGSDGSIFNVLKNLNLEIISPKPALVPIHVHSYPYESLSGISFPDAKISIYSLDKIAGTERKFEKNITAEIQGDLLLTHRNFSGPAIINISRYASIGNQLQINYYTSKDAKTILTGFKNRMPGNQQQLLTFLYEYLGLPKRFLEIICQRAKVDPTQKISQISDRHLKAIINLLTADSYKISGLGGYNLAMVTAGGVALSGVNPKTLESEKYPGLFFAGEVLNVDGDTGGYNLQFAFSSAYICATK